MNNVIDSLMLSSLRHNYVEFVELYGYEHANEKLGNLFGYAWLTYREQGWQWYDTDRQHTTEVWKLERSM